jgi:hypothetical protein
MTGFEIERAADTIRQGQTRMRRRLLSVMVAVALAAGALVALPVAALPIAAGAVAQTLTLWFERYRRREFVARLAVDPTAYVIPEVQRYGNAVAMPERRAQLADWLRQILRTTGERGALVRRERVSRYRTELRLLADDLAVPEAQPEPSSVVMCLRLLTEAGYSPLYNKNLPETDLGAAIFRIRSGLHLDETRPDHPTSGRA